MTNKELAELLNISPSGLSLVLNNKPGVADATRQRVLEQLKQLGYSDLVRKKTRRNGNICCVVYKKMEELFAQYPFFMMMLEGLEDCARKYGLNLTLIHMNGNEPMSPQLEKLEASGALGAVVFAPELCEKDVGLFQRLSTPIVYIDNPLPLLNVTSVCINNRMAARQAIGHLVRKGHKRIGYLKSRIRIRNFEEREMYYREALASYGMELRPEDIFTVRFSEQESYIDFRELLKESRPLPTALVSDDDTLAMGAHKAICDAGLNIPDDIALIGFNNRSCCTLVEPQLSSVYTPAYFYGETAIDAAVHKINRTEFPDFNLKVSLNTCLAIRGSTSSALALDVNKTGISGRD